MQYMGGKCRMSKFIVPIIEKYKGNKKYLEPFVGGSGCIISSVKGKRIASDIDSDLIQMYIDLQKGRMFPKNLSKLEYDFYRYNRHYLDCDKGLRAFYKYGCSFAGKEWGGVC